MSHCILVAKTRPALQALARQGGWQLSDDNIHRFETLENTDDLTLQEIGIIYIAEPGYVGVAYRDD